MAGRIGHWWRVGALWRQRMRSDMLQASRSEKDPCSKLSTPFQWRKADETQPIYLRLLSHQSKTCKTMHIRVWMCKLKFPFAHRTKPYVELQWLRWGTVRMITTNSRGKSEENLKDSRVSREGVIFFLLSGCVVSAKKYRRANLTELPSRRHTRLFMHVPV